MQYRQFIKKVQTYSGFSGQEAEESLKLVIEKLSARLQEGERQNFASQLPTELQETALQPTGQDRFTKIDFYEQLEEIEEIEGTSTERVKKQVMAVWQTLKEAISPGRAQRHKSAAAGRPRRRAALSICS